VTSRFRGQQSQAMARQAAGSWPLAAGTVSSRHSRFIRDWRLWFVAPAVLALALVVAFPSGYLIWMSLMRWIVTDPAIRFAGADNFIAMLGSADFWSAAQVTLAYLVISTAFMIVIALGLALTLSGMRSAGLLRALVVMPLIIPPVVVGFTWRFLLNSEMGFIGAFILPMAGVRVSLLADPIGALFSVVIADVWSRMPFMFLIFLAALQGIHKDLYEAARSDGASVWQEFFLITLPLIKGALVLAILFRIIDAINTFELIYVMTKGGPGRSTQTLSILGWKTAFQSFDLGSSAALGVIMLAVTMAVALTIFRRFLRVKA
jgi:multiple sugar transport system permease protein